MKTLIFFEKTLTLIFWVLIIFGFDLAYTGVLTILAALIHELGHFIAIVLFSRKQKSKISPSLLGFRIDAGRLTYKEEFFVALGGPLINLAVGIFFILVPDFRGMGDYFTVFGILNLLTMVSNLLPIESYDGYKILTSLIALFAKNIIKWENLLYWVSFCFCCTTTFFALYIVLKLGEGYWFFLVFFSFTLMSVIKRQKRTIYENNRDFERF